MDDSPVQIVRRSARELGRRQFIRKAAVVGAIVWTVPTIVSIEPAGAADRHSAPPVTPPGAVQQQPPPPPATVAATQQQPGQLPFTGDNQNVEFGVGLAAIAGGTALIIASAEHEHVTTA